MTVDIHGGGGALANPDDYGDIGLEDVGVGDVVIPRLTIVHDEGKFKNNLTNETFETLTVVILGLVKQRIMWDDVVDEGDKPMCKSPDFEHGFPNVNEDVKKEKQFPWSNGNFNPSDYPAEKGLNGLVTLPCNSCIFKEWDKNGWKNPPCAEQHTYPLLFTSDEGESWQPALYTVQKTGIKPSRQYISGFAQTKTPMFTVHTEIGLTLQKRGMVTYSVPWFKKKDSTDRNSWPEFGQQLRAIREFIRSAPRRYDEDDEEPVASNNENTAPEAAAAPAPATAPPAAAPAAPAASAPAGDDDLPF